MGTIILVCPGEKIPMDGIVVKGYSSLDTSALTGESLPRDVKENDEVISGCVNMAGLLHIRTTKEFGESTVSKILELVENASSRKSRSEEFISRFARVYTPEATLMEYAALAESASSHPIALALVKSWGKEPDRRRISDVQELAGSGIVAQVDGKTVAVGNKKLMQLSKRQISCLWTMTP